MDNQIEMPRRAKIWQNEPAELAILKAIKEVEKMEADPRLTEIVTQLNKAKDNLSDYIDDWYKKQIPVNNQ